MSKLELVQLHHTQRPKITYIHIQILISHLILNKIWHQVHISLKLIMCSVRGPEDTNKVTQKISSFEEKTIKTSKMCK